MREILLLYYLGFLDNKPKHRKVEFTQLVSGEIWIYPGNLDAIQNGDWTQVGPAYLPQRATATFVKK